MVPSILKKGYSACKVDGLKGHPKILNLLSLISQCGQMKSGPRKQSIPELPTGGPGQDRIWRQAPWSAEQQDNKCHQAPTAPRCHITWSSPSEARCRCTITHQRAPGDTDVPGAQRAQCSFQCALQLLQTDRAHALGSSPRSLSSHPMGYLPASATDMSF